MDEHRPVIIKVGGSLFDLPDLAPRLIRLLRPPEMRPAILVAGGGCFADVVRHFHRLHQLAEEVSHWLALDAMTLAARCLQPLLPGSSLVADPDERQHLALRVLDARRFAEADEERAGPLPHTWQVTSDSIAVRLAAISRARRLVLLKSINIPAPPNWHEASRCGFVDEFFPRAIQQCCSLSIEAINFRHSART